MFCGNHQTQRTGLHILDGFQFIHIFLGMRIPDSCRIIKNQFREVIYVNLLITFTKVSSNKSQD